MRKLILLLFLLGFSFALDLDTIKSTDTLITSTLSTADQISPREIITTMNTSSAFHYYLVNVKNHGGAISPLLFTAQGFTKKSTKIYIITGTTDYNKTFEHELVDGVGQTSYIEEHRIYHLTEETPKIRKDGTQKVLMIETNTFEQGWFNPDLSACGTIASTGVYTLTDSISTGSGTCLTINANDITIDCQGHAITGGNDGASRGILADGRTGISIYNCNISDFGINIYLKTVTDIIITNTSSNTTDTSITHQALNLDGSFNAEIFNNTISAIVGINTPSANRLAGGRHYIYNNYIQNILGDGANFPTIIINNLTDSIFENNTLVDNAEMGVIGFWWDRPSHNNTIRNNSMTSDAYGILDNVSGVSSDAYDNHFYANNITAPIWINNTNSSNFFNTTGVGNRYFFANGTEAWEVYDATCSGSAPCWADGGTDVPFDNSLTEWIGSGEDNHPWVGGAVTDLDCQELDTPNTEYTLTSNTTINSTVCFNITDENITLNCSGYTITGDNSADNYGVFSNSSNSTIKNCIIQNFSTGIYIDGDSADYANITNNSITLTYFTSCSETTGVCDGIFILGADNATIQNNTLSTFVYAISLYDSSTHNTIQYNNVSSTNYAINLRDDASFNTLQYNNVTASNFAIYLYDTSDNNIIQYNNATVSSSSTIKLSSSSNNLFQFNNVTATTDYPIAIGDSGNDFNNFTNNTLNTAGTAIYWTDADDGTGNRFTLNNITASIWVDDKEAGNFYNDSSMGNIYYFANDTPSWDVYNISTPSGNWATEGSDLPFDSDLTEWIDLGNDSHPWTENIRSIPIIQTIIMSPNTPAVTGEINCSINATDIINATFTVCASIFRDGINQTALEVCNTSYTNATIWNITTDLNSSNTMQSDKWHCEAYATDGTDVDSNISNNVTVSHIDAKIPNLFSHITNGTDTIASATKNWANFDSFSFTEQYGANQTCLIQSTFYSSAQDDLDAKYRLQQISPTTLEATYIERSLNTNKFASVIMGNLINITALDTYQFDLDFAKLNSTGANTNISNATSFLVCMHDVNTNTSLDFNGLSFFNTTTSPTFVPVFTQTITTIDRGYRAWMFSKYQISSDSDAIVETYTSINTSTFAKNGSTDYMGLTAVTSFSDGDYAYSGEKINGGVNVTYTVYAKTTNGTATLNMTGIEFAYQTSEIGDFVVTRDLNITLNTTTYTDLGPVIFSPLVANRSLIVLNAISGNATGAITNSTGKTNITDTGDDRESLINRRTFSPAQPGKIHLTPIYSNLLYSDYTYTAWGLTTPSGTSVDLIGGGRLFFATTETPTVDVNLTCGQLAVSNTNYELEENLTTTGICFNITAQNVVLDCNGYTITSDNSTGSFGVWVENIDATIINCTFHSFEAGIGTNSTGLTAYYNNFTTTFWVNDSGTDNYFNTTGAGNIYYFINKTASWEVYNITTNLPIPNWANNGTDYPFNASLDEWIGTSNDSAPWTTVQGNTFPQINQILLTPTSPLTTDILQCFVNASNGESTELNVTYEFYKDGVNQTALAGSINITNNTLTNVANVSNSLTDLGENWSCRARANDGVDFTAWVFSNNITISNVSMNTSLLYPPNNFVFGPNQCWILAVLQTNDTANSTAERNATCRLYNWNGFANSTYELLESQFSTDVNNTFNFSIAPNTTNTSYRINCSVFVEPINATTSNIDGNINGASFCEITPDQILDNEADALLIFIGMAILVAVVFVINGKCGEDEHEH